MKSLSFQKGIDPLHKMGVGQIAIIQTWLNEMGIENYTIYDDLTIDVDGSVKLWNKKIEKLPPFIKFNKVGSSFCI
jgi:hypothetical protein